MMRLVNEMFRHTILNTMTVDGKYKVVTEPPLAVFEILLATRTVGKGSVDAFQKHFFTYRTPSASDIMSLEIMTESVRLGHLKLSCEFVSTSPLIDTSLIERRGSRGRTIESSEHQAMKLWVLDFLISKGIPAAVEVSELGYKVDVGCPGQRFYVECGDTEPTKVLAFLRHGRAIGVFQYDSEEIVWFEPNPSFKSYVHEVGGGLFA